MISIAPMTLQICLSTFPLSALILICSLKPFLLPGKADTDVFDYSSFVAIGILEHPQYKCTYTSNRNQPLVELI